VGKASRSCWSLTRRHLVLHALNVCILFSNAAHKIYPLRVRVVSVVTGDVTWEPIAYIPVIRKLKEPSADLRACERRAAIFQRALFLAFRTTITACHKGVLHEQGRKTYVPFPRILTYMCDEPEEKSVLCLKGGHATFPCLSSRVRVEKGGSFHALSAENREAVRTVEAQLESAGHRQRQQYLLRRTDPRAAHSAHSRVPVVAGMAGLSTAFFLLCKTIGFDALHVRFLVSLPLLAWQPHVR